MSFKPATSGTKLLDFDGLSAKGIRFSDTHIWRLVKAGEFPEPVKIGRRSHWVEAEIDDYIAGKMVARNSQNVATNVAKGHFWHDKNRK